MGSVYTTTTTIGTAGTTPHLTPPYYADFLRENLYGSLYWRQLGTLVTIPRGMAPKVRIARWQTPVKQVQGRGVLSGSITAIQGGSVAFTEGTPINTYQLCANSICGTVTGWAGARGYTDKVVIVSMANFLEGALESLSRELAYRIDRYIRQKVSGTAVTAQAMCASGVRTGTTKKVRSAFTLFGKNLARLRPLMGANGCPMWDDGTYVGLAHELAAYDMFADTSATGFVSVARYNDARMIYRGEIGEFYGVRWLLSNSSVHRLYGTASANTLSAYTGFSAPSATYGISPGATGSHAYVFAPDGFYNLELETGGVEVIHQPLGSGGATGDPAAQLGSVAVKVFYGTLPAPSTDQRVLRFIHGLSLGY